MPRYADVAIPTGVNKTFTYLIPPELQPAARVGVRAVVPFGRKRATGLIVGLPASSDISPLKTLVDIIDPQPVLSDPLLSLCRWISSYYFAPLGEVLKAALPHSLSPGSKRRVELLLPLEDPRVVAIMRNAPARSRLLRALNTSSPALVSDLRRNIRVSTIHALINDLESAGIVRSEEILPRPKQTTRKREFLLLTPLDAAALRGMMDNLPGRKKRLRALLDTIVAAKDDGMSEIAIIDLVKKAGVSSREFRELGSFTSLPTLSRDILRQEEYGTEEQTLRIVLNGAQQGVLREVTAALHAGAPATFLLHGVTGSGKTQVYIEAIRDCLQRARSAIVRVPESSLTPQTVRRFKSHFSDDVLVMHSRMSAGERHDVWRRAYQGLCRVVIGPRSAVFAPVRNPGLIIVDEEHEASYKQFDTTPRYHARDVAIMRGREEHAVVLLGSATPSIESYDNALRGKYSLLEMPDRIDNVPLPPVQIVDMVEERKRAYSGARNLLPPEERGRLGLFRASAISPLLAEKIRDRLARAEGIILLQNRRGFAPFVQCPTCGFVEMCENCDISLTYHLAKRHVRCHYCGFVRPPREVCPQCGSPDIRLKGVGTQRVEEDLKALLPHARVIRMDLDTTSRRGAHDRLLTTFGRREVDVLLGTQMVAKGLDFPHVTLVGVISADTQLLLPDFRASERTFQLLTQVAGRAGRSELQGEVIIQSAQADHHTLQHVVHHDYRGFFHEEINHRRELDYPPFARLVLIEARGEVEEQVQSTAERLGQALSRTGGPFLLLGPAPAAIGKIKKNYRWHLLLKSRKSDDPSGRLTHVALRLALDSAAFRSPAVQVVVDVDPVSIM